MPTGCLDQNSGLLLQQEDSADLCITQLAQDFESYKQGGGTSTVHTLKSRRAVAQQEDLADLGITQLAQDFEGFEEQQPGDEGEVGGVEGARQSPASQQPLQLRQPWQQQYAQQQLEAGEGQGIVMEEGWE